MKLWGALMAQVDVKREGAYIVVQIGPWGDAPLAMADARQLARKLHDKLREAPNCMHGFGPKEPCYRCKQESAHGD